LSPDSSEYAVIEVNPRVSRSSALASKATGYPIARVAAQIAVGRRLAEIPNVVTGTTVAAFEPALDYVVVKLPRFPFDKFPMADLGRNVRIEGEVRRAGSSLVDAISSEAPLLVTAKRAGFGDRELAGLAGVGESDVRAARLGVGLRPGYAMVDTCAAEFAAETPYFYATFAAAGSPPEAMPVSRPAALVIGSGPVRIGQGIEFDYCAVQAAEALRARG